MKTTCEHEGCEAAGEWTIRMNFPAKGWRLDQHTPIQMFVDVSYCYKHALRQNNKDWIKRNPEIRRAVEAMTSALNRCPVDFRRAFIEPIKRDSDDFKKFQELNHREPD